MTKIGYGYEVNILSLERELISEPLPTDTSVHLVCLHLVHPFNYPHNPLANLWNLCT